MSDGVDNKTTNKIDIDLAAGVGSNQVPASLAEHVDIVTLPEYYNCEMTLPLRMDTGSSLAYLFGPVGALFLLLGEHKNDLVRFHAWQSIILNDFYMVLQGVLIIFGRWRALLVNMLITILINVLLTIRAYKKSAALQVFYLPVISNIAMQILLTES